jgi:CrcB protein
LCEWLCAAATGGYQRRPMMNTLVNCVAVAIGGSLGALCRFGAALAAARLFGTRFPFGTLLINVTGSFILGAFLARVARGWTVPQPIILAVTVGFLGAYTTFSTYMHESDTLLRAGDFTRASLYLLGSVALGLLCVRLGYHAGHRF